MDNPPPNRRYHPLRRRYDLPSDVPPVPSTSPFRDDYDDTRMRASLLDETDHEDEPVA
jgi:hypothetical protein